MNFITDRRLDELEGQPVTPEDFASLRYRLNQAESILKEAIRQIGYDSEALFDGDPYPTTMAQIMWAEYKRCYGIGRK